MKKIFRMQCYSLKRSYDVIFLGIILFLIFVINIYEFCQMDLTETSTAVDIFGVGASIATVFMLAAVAISVGQDMTDKTVNYDVLYGYRRRNVILGRFYASVMISFIIILMVDILPMLAMLIIRGWDENIALASIPIRLIGSLLVNVRLASEVFLLTVLLKHPYIAAFVTFLAMQIENYYTIEHHGNIKFDWLLSGVAVDQWFYYNSYESFGDNGGTVLNITSFPETAYMLGSVISSIVISILCIWLAIKIFNSRDMD